MNGKILRVDRLDGTPAPGNPFTGAGTDRCQVHGNTAATPGTACQEIFAYGLRNPWRLAFDPNTGATRFHINDVGQNTREEVDLGAVGANYGWPTARGPVRHRPESSVSATGSRRDTAHHRLPARHALTVATTSPAARSCPTVAGAPLDGGYLFADGNPGTIFFRNAAGTVNYRLRSPTSAAGISDMAFVMDTGLWSLYYVLPGANEVRKIVPTLAVPALARCAGIHARDR